MTACQGHIVPTCLRDVVELYLAPWNHGREFLRQEFPTGIGFVEMTFFNRGEDRLLAFIPYGKGKMSMEEAVVKSDFELMDRYFRRPASHFATWTESYSDKKMLIFGFKR